jgi:hypothetical protein
LACGPGEEELAGDLGEALRAGEERGRGREGADSLGPAVRERERRERVRLGLGCAERLRELASVRPMRGKEGEGKSWADGRGPAQGEREEEFGLLSSFLSFSSFLFLFYTQTIQTNLFEFK